MERVARNSDNRFGAAVEFKGWSEDLNQRRHTRMDLGGIGHTGAPVDAVKGVPPEDSETPHFSRVSSTLHSGSFPNRAGAISPPPRTSTEGH